MIPPHGKYAYDLISEVGMARFLRHRQQGEISGMLRHNHGIELPVGSIHHLCDDFLDYLLAVHESQAKAVTTLITQAGGYILALDGTCEAGTKNVFMAIDAMTNLALVTSCMSAENADDIRQVVDRAVELFGCPLATMRDLSKRIAEGRAHLPGHVKDFACQYHFLENVGNKLCGEFHSRLTKGINELKLRPKFRGLRGDLLRYSSDRHPLTSGQFKELVDHPDSARNLDPVQVRRTVAFFLLRWLDDYAADLKGEYFPFDQPALAFYRRCVQLNQLLQRHLNCDRQTAPTLHSIAQTLESLVTDRELTASAGRLQKAVTLFEELRDALRFRTTTNQPIRRQDAPPDSIEDSLQAEPRLECLRDQLRRRSCNSADPDCRKDAQIVLSYLDTYWDNLHGHVLPVPGDGRVVVAPRTNAAAEHRFGTTKRGWHRRLGTGKLARQLQSSRAEEILVGNLAYPCYVEAVYNGSLLNMPASFAACHHTVSKKRQGQKETCAEELIPVSKKTVRISEIFDKIGHVIAKMAACLP